MIYQKILKRKTNELKISLLNIRSISNEIYDLSREIRLNLKKEREKNERRIVRIRKKGKEKKKAKVGTV